MIPGPAPVLEPEVVVNVGMTELDRQAQYGGALVFNHTSQGTGKVLGIVDGSAVLLSTGSMDETVRKMMKRVTA